MYKTLSYLPLQKGEDVFQQGNNKRGTDTKNLGINKLIIYTDGAARGNPGPAAIGVIFKDEGGKTIATISRRLAPTTNNQAEYQAIIAALEKAVSLGARTLALSQTPSLS
ncbi:MAG: hypothetical protein A2Z15_01195 [Chloroflexi bacterium RBG_16_50_11]|nr:MAG: hypothetical protein A2Z15_01195 [Chloroflexi bacterium RBG_16_50_11]